MSIDQQHGTVSAEQAEREAQLVERVVASFGATPDPRFKELMQALTRHLHAFLREVRLTEEEWQRAIEFLTAAGHITDDRRQEFILLSDVLGASMQVIAINNEAHRNATEATVFGPFFVEGSPEIQLGGDIAAGAPGEPCWVEGTVTDASGKPVPHALIEVWEADQDGLYDVQYSGGRVAARGHLYSDAEGRYRFWAVTPTPYPIPHDGPVGWLLNNRPDQLNAMNALMRDEFEIAWRALDADPEPVKRGEHELDVVCLKQACHLGSAVRERTKQQRAVGDALRAGQPHRARHAGDGREIEVVHRDRSLGAG